MISLEAMMQEAREDFQNGVTPHTLLGKLMCILEVQQARIRALEQVAHGHTNPQLTRERLPHERA